MDPYVKFQYGGKKYKTKTKDNADKNPVWDELFNFTKVENENDIKLRL